MGDLMRKKVLAGIVAALLASAVMGAGSASAAWYNWFNGVLHQQQRVYEGTAHHTYGTSADSTGIFPCTGVTGSYIVCQGNQGYYYITISNYYAEGDPNGANNYYQWAPATGDHYYHLWWCSGSC
jgi:hypothetical protein